MKNSDKPWRVRESEFPSNGNIEEKAEFLLRYAVLAPSSHNSQPWEFAVEDEKVHVYADESEWLEVADADKRELYFSVGCALENLLVAVDRFGLGTTVDYSEGTSKVAEVTFGTDTASSYPSELFQAITERRTNHKVYHEEQIEEDVLDSLEQTAEGDGVELLKVTDGEEKEEITELQTRADKKQFDDPDYRKELGRWIGSGALGANWLMARVGQLAVTHLDLGESEGEKNSKLLNSAPVIAFVATSTDDREARVKAGQAFERLFLSATSEGIAVHPMNQILQVPELKEELTNLLSPADTNLQLMFRLGYAPPEDDRRPRKPVESVLREPE
jgi:nitroreductase